MIIAAPDKIASYRLLEHELTLDEITADIVDVDLILVEGYKQAGKPSIEIVRKKMGSTNLVGDLQQTLAIVTDTPLEVSVPQLGLDDIPQVADLIETWIAPMKDG